MLDVAAAAGAAAGLGLATRRRDRRLDVPAATLAAGVSSAALAAQTATIVPELISEVPPLEVVAAAASWSLLGLGGGGVAV